MVWNCPFTFRAKAYLYLESIEISKKMPVARIEIEVKQQNGVKRIPKKVTKGDNLFDLSNGLDQYRDFVVTDVNAINDTVEFKNGHVLTAGDATGDVTEETIRRIQIRETIKAHLEKEKTLFNQGIKVLSLFFIDEVAKYRDYSQADEKGDYARVFEEEYSLLVQEYLDELPLLPSEQTDAYKAYLSAIEGSRTHNGYFSIDKKSKRLANPAIDKKAAEAQVSNDTDAYDLILKDKERLLSFEEPTRFIFSHSALREGWDNPNVFVICTLKHSVYEFLLMPLRNSWHPYVRHFYSPLNADPVPLLGDEKWYCLNALMYKSQRRLDYPNLLVKQNVKK
jgi:type III restriction enzyme